MSQVRSLPSTLREKSTWTPKNFPPSNEKIFQERMTLIKKWYAAWNDKQRWTLLEYILRQQDDEKLTMIHDLLHPVLPLPDHDFTSALPRYLCLRIFSLLDPQSLCRAAQVCWYWKYLAESNELWQRKCLRLGWFLPSPPCTYDSTVWKRHYISCVCQLHWNPPQPPPEEAKEELERSNEVDGESEKKRVKKQRIPRQPLTDGPRRPWKDPDKYPKDTHYFHSNLWCEGSLNTSLNLTSSISTTVNLGITASKPRVQAQGELPFPFVPPPSSLLHPTLLEKMRLGSPSSAHIQLSTLNRAQSNQSISETFYGLQDSAPFPRLPPYYVHKPTDSNVYRTMDSSIGLGGTVGAAGKSRPATSGARPPSGRSNVSVSFPTRSNVSPQKANRTREEQLSHTKQSRSPSEVKGQCWSDSAKSKNTSSLLSKPWTIPQEEEEG